MGLTGSNMAHRLHGKKRMDDAEAVRFTEQLGSPEGWLDTPRSETDIPESVALLLAPASFARAPGHALSASAAAPNDDTLGASLRRNSTVPFGCCRQNAGNAGARMFTPTGNGAITLSVPAGSARAAATPCRYLPPDAITAACAPEYSAPPASASASA
ncbi:hypothetical protein [Caballeronia novacaledonica]|uniref:Uncharacterized protein n=1 Tax=Caballeronia novacaledonica TaxID=1544861 RepID=A0AA37IIU1_9BURK|nr:hypothetical protein [Caballeronia novacaledonica]GJH30052.1 hypothetical protein CBA19CS42_36070 [Caballeronia novacaledonica]